MNLEEKVIKEDPKYNGEIIDVTQQTVKLPNGEEAHRDIVYHSKAVGMLVLTDDNKMLMEKQWRAPVKKVTIEIPAGKLDDRDNNDPLNAVVRELNEEVRYSASEIKKLYGFYSSVGFTDEYMYLYLVKGLKRVKDELPRDKGEDLEISAYTLDEARQMSS